MSDMTYMTYMAGNVSKTLNIQPTYLALVERKSCNLILNVFKIYFKFKFKFK